jgi:tRNA dimethylallyltransferase
LVAFDLPKAEMPVMKAIGVPQISAMLRGEMTRVEVISQRHRRQHDNMPSGR